MKRRAVWAVLLAGLAAACHPTSRDLSQLDAMGAREGAGADPRQNAREDIRCETVDRVCVRLATLRGAACLRLVDAGDVDRRAMAGCAERDFATAVRLMPEDATGAERLVAAKGLANALRAVRDRSPERAEQDAADERLRGASERLAQLPDGAPYAGFFRAQSEAFRIVTGRLAPAERCAGLRAAEGRLPATPPADLAPDVARLKDSLARQISQKGCS